jgi:hypothetical protein
MKTTQYLILTWQPETLAALDKLNATCPGTVAARDMAAGFTAGEPYLIILDQAIRIAKAYHREFERPLGEDYMAEGEFRSIIAGVRAFLNFDGAAKWEAGKTHDTKDNGAIESLYWAACELAGIDGNN